MPEFHEDITQPINWRCHTPEGLIFAIETVFGFTCFQMGVVVQWRHEKIVLHLYRTGVYIRERKRGRGFRLDKACEIIERHCGYRQVIGRQNVRH